MDKVTTLSPEAIIAEIKVSALRGRGGAAFPRLAQVGCRTSNGRASEVCRR